MFILSLREMKDWTKMNYSRIIFDESNGVGCDHQPTGYDLLLKKFFRSFHDMMPIYYINTGPQFYVLLESKMTSINPIMKKNHWKIYGF